MATTYTTRHEFDCTAERYWHLFLVDEPFQEALNEHLKLVIDHQETTDLGEGADRRITRTYLFRPERNLPGFIQALVKGASQVREVNTYDPNTGIVEIEVELPVIGKRTTFRGTYRSRPLDGGARFERLFEGFCEVKIPLVGKKIEGFCMDEMKQSVDKIWAFAQAWIAKEDGREGAAA